MLETQAVLADLVGMDTTSSSSNLELISYVSALLESVGASAIRIPSSDGRKASLLARIGPDRAGGVVLSAHTDCVPVAGQPWTRDPFILHGERGRLYGRGTADMKGFLAVVLAALPRLADAGLCRPVVLALSYDEEVGTVGAPDLVERLVATQPPLSAVLVGEPTSMSVATAHKGVRFVRTEVQGRDCHSSQPQSGANAVVAGARIAVFIDGLAAEYREKAADPRFDPPFTTFNVARVSGGGAINIVPRRCVVEWEYRPVPADDNESIVARVDMFAESVILPLLRATASEATVRTEVIATVPALANDGDETAEAFFRRLAGYDGPSRSVAFGTDGGHFASRGLPTVICGPGSIDQAHRPDEYIEESQLQACERMLNALSNELCEDRSVTRG